MWSGEKFFLISQSEVHPRHQEISFVALVPFPFPTDNFTEDLCNFTQWNSINFLVGEHVWNFLPHRNPNSRTLITWSISIRAVRLPGYKMIPARRKRKEDVQNIRIVKFELRFSILRLKGNRKESPESKSSALFLCVVRLPHWHQELMLLERYFSFGEDSREMNATSFSYIRMLFVDKI